MKYLKPCPAGTILILTASFFNWSLSRLSENFCFECSYVNVCLNSFRRRCRSREENSGNYCFKMTDTDALQHTSTTDTGEFDLDSSKPLLRQMYRLENTKIPAPDVDLQKKIKITTLPVAYCQWAHIYQILPHITTNYVSPHKALLPADGREI